MTNEAHKKLILASGLFDRDWYVKQVGASLADIGDPVDHYLNAGPSATADPHPLFHHSWYRDVYPDVAAAQVNPLVHFLLQGIQERRRPNRMFDTGWYLNQYQDVASAGINPLVHFLQSGAEENRNPHPDFDTAWYRQQTKDLAFQQLNPLTHYLLYGKDRGISTIPGRIGSKKRTPILSQENGLRVHIKYSDSGWILERMVYELEARLDYVRADVTPDPMAPVQYYMNYAERQKRVSPLEFAWFTHIEENDAELTRRFFTTARNVDVAVCHSDLYAGILRNHSVQNVFTINPGVDLNSFVPKLKIGVVGRTYDYSGRKGEKMIAEMIDAPDVEWHFTGSGWPLPARYLKPHELPNFYRSMDYILVSSLFEGGPMCVVEALACGTPVIAPPVGWVPQFPYIPYKTGDAGDLRRVLSELLAKKTALRKSVEHLTWQNFADRHDQLFRRFYNEKFPEGMSSRRRHRFEHVYNERIWGGDSRERATPIFSGEGSLPEFSKAFAELVTSYCERFSVKRLVDLGCGDFQVGELIAGATGLDYVGVDISSTVIEHNLQRVKNDRVTFICADIVTDDLPDGDLVIIRQVLQHLSNTTIQTLLERVAKYPHVLICDEVNLNCARPNEDIEDGGPTRFNMGSTLLLELAPFDKTIEVMLVGPAHRPENVLRTIRLLD